MWNVPDIVLTVWYKEMSKTKNILEIMELPFFFFLPVCPSTDPFIYLWHICMDNCSSKQQKHYSHRGKKKTWCLVMFTVLVHF